MLKENLLLYCLDQVQWGGRERELWWREASLYLMCKRALCVCYVLVTPFFTVSYFCCCCCYKDVCTENEWYRNRKHLKCCVWIRTQSSLNWISSGGQCPVLFEVYLLLSYVVQRCWRSAYKSWLELSRTNSSSQYSSKLLLCFTSEPSNKVLIVSFSLFILYFFLSKKCTIIKTQWCSDLFSSLLLVFALKLDANWLYNINKSLSQFFFYILLFFCKPHNDCVFTHSKYYNIITTTTTMTFDTCSRVQMCKILLLRKGKEDRKKLNFRVPVLISFGPPSPSSSSSVGFFPLFVVFFLTK